MAIASDFCKFCFYEKIRAQEAEAARDNNDAQGVVNISQIGCTETPLIFVSADIVNINVLCNSTILEQ